MTPTPRCRLSRLAPCIAATLVSVALASCSSATGSPDEQGDAVAAGDSGTVIVTVPDVTNQDGADAESELQGEGHEVAFEDDRSDAAGCHVTDQDPAGGTELDPDTDATEVTLTLDCRQVDWENQEGDDWETFNSTYSDGWDSGCDDLFSLSPDGATLHYDGEEFSAVDCQNGNPGDASDADMPEDVPEDAEADGEALGAADGCAYVFEELAPGGALYYGSQQFTETLCRRDGDGAAAALPAKPRAKALNASKLTRAF